MKIKYTFALYQNKPNQTQFQAFDAGRALRFASLTQDRRRVSSQGELERSFWMREALPANKFSFSSVGFWQGCAL